MTWRALGHVGERYPAWVVELSGKSGVYAIRQIGVLGGRTIVYVGESHTGNLRKTLTRHFQTWARTKDWWRNFFGGADTDPGHTYGRAGCEVAVQISSPGVAVKLQGEWIDRLKPRDNVQIAAAPVPF